MSTVKTSHRSIVSLKLPRSPTALTAFGTGVVKAMTGNPLFPAPVPTLAAVTAAIGDLTAAEPAAQSRIKGAVTTRNEKSTVLGSLLLQLKAYVQATADADRKSVV